MKDEENKLLISITNHGAIPEEVELRMNFGGQERPLGSINVAGHTTIMDTAIVRIDQTGWHDLVLSINDYPITFDNNLFASINISNKIDILSISEGRPNDYLKTAFSAIDY